MEKSAPPVGKTRKSLMRRYIPYAFLIASLTFLVYHPVISHGFLNYDDDIHISDTSSGKKA